MRVVPPLRRRWNELFPRPYNTEIPVIAYVFPADWTFHEGCTKDEKYQLLAAKAPDESKVLGLQVVDVDVPKYMDQRELFAEYEIKTPGPEYIGPIGLFPQDLLLDETKTVILLVRDAMWREPLNMKRVFKQQPPEKRC